MHSSNKKSNFVDKFINYINNNRDIKDIVIYHINVDDYEKKEKRKKEFLKKYPPKKN